MRALLTRLRTDDRGTAGLELAILGPALVVFLVLLAGAGRIALAGNAVETAAAVAAREASLARTAADAETAAYNTAQISMSQSGVNCVSLSVDIDSSGLNAPLGTTGTVAADITCVVALSDAAIIGLPGTHTLAGHATSPVDAYRQRE